MRLGVKGSQVQILSAEISGEALTPKFCRTDEFGGAGAVSYTHLTLPTTPYV